MHAWKLIMCNGNGHGMATEGELCKESKFGLKKVLCLLKA